MTDFIAQCHNEKCDKQFITDSPSVKYCSTKCQKEQARSNLVSEVLAKSIEKYKHIPDIPTCKICGHMAPRLTNHLLDIHKIKEKTYRRKYKAKTADIYHPSYIEEVTSPNERKYKTCPECGDEFEQTTTRKDYCTRTCAATAHRYKMKLFMRDVGKQKKNNTYNPHQPITINCKNCGEEIQNAYISQKYCNEKCRNKYHNDRKEKPKPMIHPCRNPKCEKEVVGRQIYCSVACRKETQKDDKLARTVSKSQQLYGDDPEIPSCIICGFKGKHLHTHIINYHDMTQKEYCEEFDIPHDNLTYHKTKELRIKNVRENTFRVRDKWLKSHKAKITI